MSSDRPDDRYDQGYATKLWQLLPAVYRAEDSTDPDQAGPLEEIVRRVGAQVAVVRRSIDRLWEDQSIEGCDDWLIPYLGELVATNLVPSLDARGQRLDVAKTVHYRRRKGTVAVLEELAQDVTGWSARVVEMFRRLARTRHGLDPAIGLPSPPVVSRTVARNGSTGTLDVVGAPLATVILAVRIDTAGQAGAAGWSASIDGGEWIAMGAVGGAAIRLAGGGALAITLVDGTGAPSFLAGDELTIRVAADRVTQLQRAQGLVGVRTRTPAGGIADLRDVLGARQSRTAFDELAHTADVRRGRGLTGWHDIPRLGVFVWRLRSFALEQVTPVKHLTCPGHYTFDPTGRDVPLFAAGERPDYATWTARGAEALPGPITPALIADQLTALYRTEDEQRSLAIYRVTAGVPVLVPRGEIGSDCRRVGAQPVIDAERGRVVWTALPANTALSVDYHQGFSSAIGAGSYERPLVDDLPAASTPPVRGGGALPAVLATDALAIGDSLTYTTPPAAPPVQALAISAADERRPLLRLRRRVPHRWIITGAGPTARLVLDGLFVSGNDLVLRGQFASVTLSCCTLDPGTRDAAAWRHAADRRSLVASWLRIEGRIEELVIDRCITGPIAAARGGRVESLVIRESIVQAAHPGAAALVVNGEVDVTRTTVLGATHAHRLEASECIFDGHVAVDDCQRGCVRFSAYADGSVLPRPYESVKLPPGHALFEATQFGAPAFAQLSPSAGDAIAAGAENGSEMGAFWREKNAIKERSLLIKYQEYLPLGLEPVIVHVT